MTGTKIPSTSDDSAEVIADWHCMTWHENVPGFRFEQLGIEYQKVLEASAPALHVEGRCQHPNFWNFAITSVYCSFWGILNLLCVQVLEVPSLQRIWIHGYLKENYANFNFPDFLKFSTRSFQIFDEPSVRFTKRCEILTKDMISLAKTSQLFATQWYFFTMFYEILTMDMVLLTISCQIFRNQRFPSVKLRRAS